MDLFFVSLHLHFRLKLFLSFAFSARKHSSDGGLGCRNFRLETRTPTPNQAHSRSYFTRLRELQLLEEGEPQVFTRTLQMKIQL